VSSFSEESVVFLLTTPTIVARPDNRLAGSRV
jgi:hypothetical protein